MKQSTARWGSVAETAQRIGGEALSLFWTLVRIMVPLMILVRLLEQWGAIDLLAKFLEPVMGLVGLPGEAALVWASAMLTNLYGGMAVLAVLSDGTPLTVAQVSVLTTMMLIAHGLPVEVAIARAAGVRARATLLVRLGGALLAGVLISTLYQWGGWLQQPNLLIWSPEVADASWSSWLIAQGEGLLWIFFIILALLLFLDLLKALGITAWLGRVLSPLLRSLGIGEQTVTLAMVGITIGVSYGGALLIKESQAGHLPPKDIFGAMMLLGLTHSLFEDTALMVLMGGHLSALLVGRVAVTILLMVIIMRVVNSMSEAHFNRWLWHANSPVHSGG
uniref:Nucleoside transporter/FeoB GTPase Gate domain-containing protein n=1 Tax=Magnetococcus massalia (strain MO-1) TaxID=451514 RepID=A0A1S7LJ23_MAGMO|nr:Conserved protein of unknown function. Putative Fe2+ transporters. Putative nucleoside recognition domain protein [Candidatus Magnetococcus massalia]